MVKGAPMMAVKMVSTLAATANPSDVDDRTARTAAPVSTCTTTRCASEITATSAGSATAREMAHACACAWARFHVCVCGWAIAPRTLCNF